MRLKGLLGIINKTKEKADSEQNTMGYGQQDLESWRYGLGSENCCISTRDLA